MKTKILQTTILLTLVLATNACAKQATWLDGGNNVHATIKETNSTIEKTINKDRSFEITLSTKQKAMVLGGVYVKTTDVKTVLNWADEHGYEAKKHAVIDGAVKVKTSPSQAITVANQIAELKGVTTAAPNLGRKMNKR